MPKLNLPRLAVLALAVPLATLPVVAATSADASPNALRISAVTVTAPEFQAPTPEDEVRAALQHYLMAHATGDGEHHKQVFHPEARLFWVRDGQFSQRTSAEYIGSSSGRPAADEAQRRRWIESVDVTGDAAVAKIILDYPNARFTDYMSMLKVDGQWRIVNKTFHVAPKAR